MKRDYIGSMYDHWQEQVSEDKGGEEHLATQLKLYIPTSLGGAEAATAEQRKDASGEIQAFLQSDKRLLLLLGDSGAGKTLFGQWLVNDCWQRPSLDFIPLFIHLPAQNIKTFSLEKYLITQYEFTDRDVADLKANNRFLLILDAYDEMKIKHRGKNFYRLGKLYQWDIKVIISCRTEALVSFDPIAQRLMFQPCDNAEEPLPLAWEKRYVQFFDPNRDLPQYIERWKRYNPELVQLNLNYLQILTKLPGLLKMIENPFILWIVMAALPDLLAKYADQPMLERYHQTRLELFDTFTTLWFKRQRAKLLKNGLISDISRESILADYRCYCEQLANLMWQKKITSITYDPARNPAPGRLAVANVAELLNLNEEIWVPFFAQDGHFMGDREKPLLAYIRQGALLRIIDGKTYAFLHHSLLEYFSAQRLFKSAANKATIALGLEINAQLFTHDATRIRLAVDCVRTDPVFEEALWDIIEESKSEAGVAIAAANAITILVAANKSFSGKDLRRIRIRHANLSEGNFEGADLREADLRDVTLSSAHLVRTELAGSCLDRIITGSAFAEKFNANVVACAFQKEKGYYGAITPDAVHIYDTITHKKINHFNSIKLNSERCPPLLTAFAFIPHTDTMLIVNDEYLQLISVTNGKELRFFYVDPYSIVISLDGRWALTVATKGRLAEFTCWECATWQRKGSWCQIDKDITISAIAVYSDGMYALSADDRTNSIKRWNCATGECLGNWQGHHSSIFSLVVSSDGRWALSGSSDMTIRRWDCDTGVCLAIWQGHTNEISQLVLSSDQSWVLSLDFNNNIKRWDCATGECVATWESIVKRGYKGSDSRLALSPDDRWVLLIDRHTLYHMELIITESYQKKLVSGHEGEVTSLAFSLDGRLLLSQSYHETLCWNCKTGDKVARLSTEDFYFTAMGGGWAITGAEGITIRVDYGVKSVDINQTIGIGPLTDTQAIGSWFSSPDGRWALGSWISSPDGRWAFFVTGGVIKRWDCWTGQCVATWSLGEQFFIDKFTPMALCFETNCLLVTSGEGIIRLDITTGEWTQWRSPFRQHRINSLLLSKNGRLAISSDFHGRLSRWDCTTGLCEATWETEPFRSLRFYSSSVIGLAMSPDSLWAASCSKDLGEVILWQLSTGRGTMLDNLGVRTVTWSTTDPLLVIMGFKDGSIRAYSFNEETLSMHLRWHCDNKILQLRDCQMLNVHGLSELQQLFFSQQGARLHASTKSSDEIIEQRKQRVPDVYDSPRRSLFDVTYVVYLHYWIVTVARRKTGAGAQHAFLILESVEKPSSAEPICYRIRRIDFVLELRHFALPAGAKKPEKTDTFGQGLIEIADKNIGEATDLARNCHHRSAQITEAAGQQLLQAINEDQRQRVAYCKAGSGDIYRILRMREAVEHHNCLSWIRKHLEAINVDIVERHFADFIVEVPSAKVV
jgi:WD40 repeat protein